MSRITAPRSNTVTVFEAPDGTYFVRVGLGRIWFDTLEEAKEQVGDGAHFGGMASTHLDPHDDGWDEIEDNR